MGKALAKYENDAENTKFFAKQTKRKKKKK